MIVRVPADMGATLAALTRFCRIAVPMVKLAAWVFVNVAVKVVAVTAVTVTVSWLRACVDQQFGAHGNVRLHESGDYRLPAQPS